MILRTLPGFALRALALLILLGVGACADTIATNEVTPSKELLKDYDKTLTRTEQKAVISDLEEAQAKARGESSPDATSSTGAKSAKEQN